MSYFDSRLVALRKARLAAEAADDALSAFVRRYGSPRGIAGEKHTAEQRAEYRKLMQDAEATAGSYAELKYNTQ